MMLCECGCGLPAPIAKETNPRRGRVKGQPFRFRQGHAQRGRSGEASNSWTGGRVDDGQGYVLVHAKDHPRSRQGYVLEHILIAERAIGRLLPVGVEVHHVNERRADNRNANLVICENRDYHRLLHARKRAYEACGDPDARKCKYCKQWDREVRSSGTSYCHRRCQSIYDKNRHINKNSRISLHDSSTCQEDGCVKCREFNQDEEADRRYRTRLGE